jgi:hypothetical protein
MGFGFFLLFCLLLYGVIAVAFLAVFGALARRDWPRFIPIGFVALAWLLFYLLFNAVVPSGAMNSSQFADGLTLVYLGGVLLCAWTIQFLLRLARNRPQSTSRDASD